MTNLPRPLKVGIIGLGGIAKASHIPALLALHERNWPVSVVALADPDGERVEAALQTLAPLRRSGSACRTYSDGDTLIAAGEVDALLLLTPPAQTAPLLERALKQGIPTLAEKPGATSAEILGRLVAVEKAAANPIARIAYNRHSLPLVPSFLTLLHEMRQNTASDVLHVEARLWRAQRDAPIFYDDTMVHALDFLNWCVGPLSVEHVEWWPASASGGLRSGLRISFRAASDGLPTLTAHLDVRPAIGRDVETYEVLGEKQSLRLSYPPPGNAHAEAELIHYGKGKAAKAPCANAEDSSDLAAQGFLPQLTHFLQLAAGDTSAGTLLCTLTQAYETALLKKEVLRMSELSVATMV